MTVAAETAADFCLAAVATSRRTNCAASSGPDESDGAECVAEVEGQHMCLEHAAMNSSLEDF